MNRESLPLTLSLPALSLSNVSEGHTHPITKRKRGGQKGNQNARKHGFYSPALSVEDISQFWKLTAVQGLDPEVALVRLKLQAFLQQDPGNPRVISDASRLLAKWCRSKYRLDRVETSYLKNAIETILQQSIMQSVSIPDPQNEPRAL